MGIVRDFTDLLRVRKKRAGQRAPVLIVSRDATLAHRCRREGTNTATRTLTTKSTAEALRQASRSSIAAAIVDMRFSDARMDGLELALNLRDCDKSLPVWLADSNVRRGRVPVATPVGGAGKGIFARGKASADLHTIFKHARSHVVKGGQ